jgi:hypothetical protein
MVGRLRRFFRYDPKIIRIHGYFIARVAIVSNGYLGLGVPNVGVWARTAMGGAWVYILPLGPRLLHLFFSDHTY